MANLALGNFVVEYGTIGTGGALPTTWKNMGCILSGSGTVTSAAGDELTVMCEDGSTADKATREPVITITGSVVDLNDTVMADFWNVDTTTSPGKTLVLGTVTPTNHAFRISAGNKVGSKRLTIPNGAMSMTPAMTSAQGWTLDFTITILRSELNNELFEVDSIPAAPEA